MLNKFLARYFQVGKGLSIHARTLFSISLVLTLFLSLAGAALDSYFVKSVENNLREQLQNHIYALLAAAKEDPQGKMRLPEILPDPKLNRPDSGLLAYVSGEKGLYHWSSGSYLGSAVAKTTLFTATQQLPPGQYHYQSDVQHFAHMSLVIIWEDLQGIEISYSLQVAMERADAEERIKGFRVVIWQWFLAAIVLLLLVQGWVLNWGLRPLRLASQELQAIESGKQEKLIGQYPIELSSLTENINSLLQHSNASLQRYRNSLGDLAHSLKTPLAIMQSSNDSVDSLPASDSLLPPVSQQQKQTTAEQLQRIDELISYQLQKASIMGNGPITIVTEVKPVIEKIIRALNKVYADKQVNCHFHQLDKVLFRGDQSDLMELAGNLLDNAYKYCRQEVEVSIMLSKAAGQEEENQEEKGQKGEGANRQFIFSIVDDGSGIAEDQQEDLLQRGRRADQSHLSEAVIGHGIGLSIVTEIVSLYQGKLLLNPDGRQSHLKGLWVKVYLPVV